MSNDYRDDSTARSFGDVMDFPIRVGYLDEHTRLLLGPWGRYDGAAAVVLGGGTFWATYHWSDSGHARAIFIYGLILTALVVYLARQIPISRPSPEYRMLWLLNSFIGTQSRADVTGKRDPWKSPPKTVIDNLVFTKGGVYADFILSGQASGMEPFSQRRKVADDHRPLVRQLPSGMVFWGMSPQVDPTLILQRMLKGREHQPRWVREVREWEPYIRSNPFYEDVFGVRIAVDAGMAGRSGAGAIAKLAATVVGRDHDAPETLEAFGEVIDELLAKIPSDFEARPATPQQIQWLYERHWTRGAVSRPFPHSDGGPRRLGRKDFSWMTPIEFDEGDQQARKQHRSWWRRLWPSRKPVVVLRGPAGASYQTLLPVAELPSGGLSFPGAEILQSAYDVHFDADVDCDWYQHVSTTAREKELNRVERAQRNLNDQSFQTSGARDTDLADRYAAGEDYERELNSSSLERATHSTTVLAIGAATESARADAVQQLTTHFAEELDTVLAARGGAQSSLWEMGHPGSEGRAPHSQFSQPTTTRQWARYAPLVSSVLGHETGIPFARNLATRRNKLVNLDFEGMKDRRGAPGMLWFGAPGGGKSQSCKRVVDALIKRGHQASILEPGTMREWVPALAHHGDRVALIDPVSGKWSLDGLKIFPGKDAVEHTLDHLLPMMGMDAVSAPARQFARLLRPGDAVAKDLGGLVRWFKNLDRKDYAEFEELADSLIYYSEKDYLRAMFDESLPAPPLREKDAVIWALGGVELPSSSETEEVHLYRRQSPRARAGLAIYGMIASLTRLTYTDPRTRRPDAFGFMVAEEAREYFASPVGRKDAQRMGLQGRKEKYGLLAISQYVEHFEGIGIQNLPMRVITPFKPTDRDYARDSFRRLGIDPDEYPEVLDTRVQEGRGLAYLFDDLGRVGLVDMLPPVQQELVDAFDTRDMTDQGWAA
ncbi:ATP-binding protein [Mycolicibacterium sphagni]